MWCHCPTVCAEGTPPDNPRRWGSHPLPYVLASQGVRQTPTSQGLPGEVGPVRVSLPGDYLIWSPPWSRVLLWAPYCPECQRRISSWSHDPLEADREGANHLLWRHGAGRDLPGHAGMVTLSEAPR